MQYLLGVLLFVHGLIHLMGFVQAFKLAPMRGLTQAISPPVGVLWLLCALALVAAGGLLLCRREAWWMVALPAVLISQGLIIAAWGDAKFGTIPNVLILLAVLPNLLSVLPGGYRQRYQAAVREGLARTTVQPVVTEADLQPLPDPVQRYLRYAGVVGKPRVQNVRAVFTGTFRNGLRSPWMHFRSQQVNFYDRYARFFLMDASLFGIPLQGLHAFGEHGATFQVKVANLLPVANAAGAQMDQGETVTLFNDLCLLAPAALLDQEHIRWTPIDAHTVRAAFTHRGITITATLSFDDTGALTNFVSPDRYLTADGNTYASYPWSTPVHAYKEVAGRHVPAEAETIWQMPEGDFLYGRFRLEEIAYNVGRK